MIKEIQTISIALTSYNPKVSLLERQLKSICKQTYNNWICCITIDNDQNNTFQSKEIKKILEDKRFKLYYNPERLGFLKNFQKAISHCLEFDSDALIMADHDDEWLPNRLEILRENLIGKPDYSLVHSDMYIRIQGENSDEILKDTVWQREKRNVLSKKPCMVLQRNIVGGATALVDIKLFQRFPTIPEGVDFHDHWYAILSSLLGELHEVNEILYIYTQHESNIAGASKYEGVLTLSDEQKAKGLINTCIGKWHSCYKYLKLVKNETDIQVPLIMKTLFLQRFDLGIINLFMSLNYFFRDKALFRASIAVGIGKFFSLFKVYQNE